MKAFEVSETVLINAPTEVVCAQFADVAHHATAKVHKGVDFELIEAETNGCRYRQVSRVGPLRLVQELRLVKESENRLVNHVLAGQFTGGSITFTITANETGSKVEAQLTAPLPATQRLLAPVLSRVVRRSLRQALAEDRLDLETGNYSPQVEPACAR